MVLEKETKELQERIFIIDLYDRCGLEYVKERFKVSRSAIYLWKEKLREEGILGLKNKTRAPINKRKSKRKNRYRNMKIKELREIVQIDSIHLRYRDIKL